MKLAAISFALFALAISTHAQTTYSVFLNSAQENVSTNLSPATGSGTMTLNLDNTITYSISYSLLEGDYSASHIHGPAAPGVNAGVLFNLVNVAIDTHSGTLTGTTPALTPAQISDLNSGLYYANIHSSVHVGGEIRGQIQVVPEPSALALLAAGLTGLHLYRRRRQ
jgi:hypothetical protein